MFWKKKKKENKVIVHTIQTSYIDYMVDLGDPEVVNKINYYIQMCMAQQHFKTFPVSSKELLDTLTSPVLTTKRMQLEYILNNYVKTLCDNPVEVSNALEVHRISSVVD